MEKEAQTTKIITIGLFLTTLVAGCVASPIPQPLETKLMDRDVVRIRDLRKEDGHILHERLSYDHKSNVVMVQTPGNFSGDSPAILVIDYDRALVFGHVLDVDECFIFPLRDDLRNLVNTELSTPDEQVVDVAHAAANDHYAVYDVAGEIPNSLVQSFSGPTVVGMCAGRNTFWLERKNKLSNLRQKRGCTTIAILWGAIVVQIC